MSAYVYDFCLRWAQFPMRVADLLDEKGQVDHSKLTPFLVIHYVIAIVTGLLVTRQLQTMNVASLVALVFLLALIIGAAYGYAGYRTAMKRATWGFGMMATASDARESRTERRDVHEVRETIVRLEEKRDADGGFEYDEDDRRPA